MVRSTPVIAPAPRTATRVTTTMKLRVARIVPRTEAEGPGLRFAVWTQGCPLRCRGCCNPEMLDPGGGVDQEVDRLIAAIAATARESPISGVTLLGGEPFAQPRPAAGLAAAVRTLGLSMAVFTGYDLGELRRDPDPAVGDLLAATDLLFAGRYRRELPEDRRRWIGSRNQLLHFLTSRYSPNDPRFFAGNTVELRLVGGRLEVNGWPSAADAVVRGGA